jgi:hypothetical protein
MVNLAVDQQYVASIATQFATLNAQAYADYQNVYQDYLIAQQSAGPGAAPPVAPVPPQLLVLNTVAALALVVAVDGAWGTLAPGAQPPVLNLTSAIGYVQAPAIQPPAPPVTLPPTDPVGPSEGANTITGNAMFETVVGDTSPAGSVFVDPRGTFVKVGSPSPMGTEYFWEKVA